MLVSGVSSLARTAAPSIATSIPLFERPFTDSNAGQANHESNVAKDEKIKGDPNPPASKITFSSPGFLVVGRLQPPPPPEPEASHYTLVASAFDEEGGVSFSFSGGVKPAQMSAFLDHVQRLQNDLENSDDAIGTRSGWTNTITKDMNAILEDSNNLNISHFWIKPPPIVGANNAFADSPGATAGANVNTEKRGHFKLAPSNIRSSGKVSNQQASRATMCLSVYSSLPAALASNTATDNLIHIVA